MKPSWKTIRRVWVTVGIAATVVFALWNLIAFRASSTAHQALESDDDVNIARMGNYWRIQPKGNVFDAGMVFFPGGLVDPVAYGPLVRQVAEAGFPVLLVELPRRGAFGGAGGSEIETRTRGAMQSVPGVGHWIVAGHSLGGATAARLARDYPSLFRGLVLIGTSHPRDFSLAGTSLLVTRVLGTRDTVADVEKLRETRHNLPPTTVEVTIDGGNHSQFGYYGFQFGDWPASITREKQHQITRDALIDILDRIRRGDGS